MEDVYYYLVKRGKKTVDQVHSKFKAKVKARIEKDKK